MSHFGEVIALAVGALTAKGHGVLETMDLIHRMVTPPWMGIYRAKSISSLREEYQQQKQLQAGGLFLPRIMLNFMVSRASFDQDHAFGFQGILLRAW